MTHTTLAAARTRARPALSHGSTSVELRSIELHRQHAPSWSAPHDPSNIASRAGEQGGASPRHHRSGHELAVGILRASKRRTVSRPRRQEVKPTSVRRSGPPSADGEGQRGAEEAPAGERSRQSRPPSVQVCANAHQRHEPRPGCLFLWRSSGSSLRGSPPVSVAPPPPCPVEGDSSWPMPPAASVTFGWRL